MHKKLNDIKNTGFNVPKDYFNSLEETVFNKIKTEDIFADIENPGFKMPENYLNDMEDKVLRTIKTEQPKVISLTSRRNLLYMSGVAAAVVLLFSLYINKGGSINNTELTPAMVESYIINQDISSYELAALLTEDELSNINLDIMDEAFSDEDMEDYLIENINIEDLIEQ